MEIFISVLYGMKDNCEYNGAVNVNFSDRLGMLGSCTIENFDNIDLNSCAIIPMYKYRRIHLISNNLR